MSARAKMKGPTPPKGPPADDAGWLEKLLRCALYGILFTPLAVWHQFLFPQLTAKVLAFQVLVEIAVAAAAARALVDARPISMRLRNAARSVPAALLLTLAAASLGAFAGVDARRSFWGFVDRQDGLVLWLHLAAWVAVVVWYFSRAGDSILGYARFSFWVAVAVAFTAVFEALCAEFLGEAPFLIRSIVQGRPSGVFGNPIALGPYLVAHVFFGFYDAVSQMSKRRRIVVLAAAEAVLLAAIFLGQTRGVLAGLALGVAVIAGRVALLRTSGRAARAAAAAAILLVVAAPALAWALRHQAAGAAIVGRFLRLGAGESAEMRRMTWSSAIAGFRDRAVVGWGHDNVYYALNRHYDPGHVRFNLAFTESRATWYDKSHNAFLDLAVERGLIGLALSALLGAVVFLRLLRIDDPMLQAALAAALVAHLASNFVAFDTFGSMFGLGLTLALVESRGRGASEEPPAGREARLGARSRRGLLGLVGAALAIALYGNVEIARAVAGYLQAQSVFPAQPADGIEVYRATFERFSPYHPKEKLNCAYMTVNAAVQKRELPPGTLDLAVDLTRQAIEAHPRDAALHMVANDIYNGLALAGERRFLADAEAAGRRALELSPSRQEVMFNLGRTYVLAGQAARAVELNRRLVAENPEFPIAHWFLGLSLLAGGKNREAADSIRKAIALGYRFQSPREAEVARNLLR